ncbi:MAG TPA: type II secretion system protein GspJ [bacterium]|nr:type II secretion system protein GspJ [bacterium]
MGRKGFSLIEVLVAMSITVILASSVYFSFSNVIAGRSRIKDITERERKIYFTLELIRNDLKNAFLTSNKGVPEETHTTIFKSEEDDPVSHLTFTTLNHVKMAAGVKQCDQTEIEYYGENVEGENVLFRRESLWIDEFPEKGGNVYPVMSGFEKLSFQYWKESSKEWVDQWNTESADNLNALPPKVKIIMLVKEGDSGEEDYLIETVVEIKMKRPLSF